MKALKFLTISIIVFFCFTQCINEQDRISKLELSCLKLNQQESIIEIYKKYLSNSKLDTALYLQQNILKELKEYNRISKKLPSYGDSIELAEQDLRQMINIFFLIEQITVERNKYIKSKCPQLFESSEWQNALSNGITMNDDTRVHLGDIAYYFAGQILTTKLKEIVDELKSAKTDSIVMNLSLKEIKIREKSQWFFDKVFELVGGKKYLKEKKYYMNQLFDLYVDFGKANTTIGVEAVNKNLYTDKTREYLFSAMKYYKKAALLKPKNTDAYELQNKGKERYGEFFYARAAYKMNDCVYRLRKNESFQSVIARANNALEDVQIAKRYIKRSQLDEVERRLHHLLELINDDMKKNH